jgi:hypothetical protein
MPMPRNWPSYPSSQRKAHFSLFRTAKILRLSSILPMIADVLRIQPVAANRVVSSWPTNHGFIFEATAQGKAAALAWPQMPELSSS